MQTIYVPEFPSLRRPGFSPLSCFAVRDGENGGNGGGGGEIPKAHVWRPIEDMPVAFDDKARAAEEELRVLAGIWQEQRADFDQQELEKFNSELNREWAVETGLIERAYHLERGTTQLLIERGIQEALIPRHNGQDPAEVVVMLRDHENVVKALFDFVASDRELSVSYVKQLHAEMLRSQKTVKGVDQFGNVTRVPMNHGVFKKRSNNPFTPDGLLHEYCPPEHVDSEMDMLIAMHKTHEGHPPLARAAWLHHRFVQIHPFEDGNGRIARCLATLVFIRAGMFPLVVLNEERDKYIDALDDANRGDLSPLVCRLAEWQKRHFVKALGIVGQVQKEFRRENLVADPAPLVPFPDALRESPLDQQIDSLAGFLARKGRQQQAALAERHSAAIKTAERLFALARGRLQETAGQITERLGDDGKAWADSASEGGYKDHYYRHQIVETAKALGYYANTDVHRAWAQLALQASDQRAKLLLFFHGIGRTYRGVIACSACFVVRRRAGDHGDEQREKEPVPLGDGVFQINYREEESQAAKRFESWLDEVIQAAIARVQEEF